MLLGSFGDMPIESRKIDQHHTVDFAALKDIGCDVGDPKKLAKLGDYFRKSNHCHLRQIKIALEASRLHHFDAAETTALKRVILLAKGADKIGGVQIAAGLAH